MATVVVTPQGYFEETGTEVIVTPEGYFEGTTTGGAVGDASGTATATVGGLTLAGAGGAVGDASGTATATVGGLTLAGAGDAQTNTGEASGTANATVGGLTLVGSGGAVGDASRPVTGGVMDVTPVVPQNDVGTPVTPVGGLNSSIIAVSPNEGQGPDNLLFEADVADRTAALIGGGGTDGTGTPIAPLVLETAQPGTSTTTGKGIRYSIATGAPVASGAAFPNTYVNETDPAETVVEDGGALAEEP